MSEKQKGAESFMDMLKLIKVLLVCVAIPFVVTFLICVVLPVLLVFLLIGMIFAPQRIRGTFQQFRKRPEPQKNDDGNIDVECTVLKSEEIRSDS